MKEPINIALIAVIVLLLGFTIYKKIGGGSPSESSVPAGPVDTNGFTVLDFEGTPIKKLEKHDENGVLLERGETLDDLKTGTWTTYYSDGRVKSISSYLAGKLDGVYVTISDKGDVELQAFYKDGLLDGIWTTYANGTRKSEERIYNMGKLDGINRHYDKYGKLQKEVGFKNDLQHGAFKQYDGEGNILLEYEYNNGEKVSGGIVKE